MAPMYGSPNYDFNNSPNEQDEAANSEENRNGVTEMAFWYMIVLVGMLLLWLFVFFFLRLITLSTLSYHMICLSTYILRR